MTHAASVFEGQAIRKRWYPEIGAGGFSRIDGTVEFYSRVQAVLPGAGTVVDLGAGRGNWQEDSCQWRRRLCDLRAVGRLVVGADIDPAVENNTGVDVAVLLGHGGMLPFSDGSLRVVVADWVFEHIDDPLITAQELARTVAPGGWVCARTPNKWGYVGVGARLVPNRHHVQFLRRLQPYRDEADVFPVRYKLNTLDAIRTAFPAAHWRHCSYGYNPDPGYTGHSISGLLLVEAWQRVAPEVLCATLHIFLQRRETLAGPGGQEGTG